MNFHDVRFPTSISLGSSGGIERRTEIVKLMSGFEERNTAWSQSRRKYDAGLGIRSLDELDEVMSFFEARRGMLYGFRWKDWFDHKSCLPSETPSATDQPIGLGDGVNCDFQLKKTYAPGPYSYERTITKPESTNVFIAIDGESIPSSSFNMNDLTGIVQFYQAPPPDARVTAGFHFDVPVRFDTDILEINFAAFKAGSIPNIPIVEVRV